MLTVYHYPRCSTCKKALKWLAAHDVPVTLVDIVAAPPSRNVLAETLKTAGVPVQKLFNTSGELYREGNYKERLASLSEGQALAELAEHGKLIKRPLVVGTLGKRRIALVGFREAEYAEIFG